MDHTAPIPTPAPAESAERIIELQGQQHLVLDRLDQIYLVREGYVAIYLVRVVDGRPTGPRHYLFSCHEGSALYGSGVTDPEGEYALLAAAIEPCRVQTCPIAGAPSADDLPALAGGLHNWVQHLCGLMGEHTRTQFSEKCEPGTPFVLQEGQILRTSGYGLRLLHLRQGSLRPLGHPVLLVDAVETPRLATTSDLWLRVESASVDGEFADANALTDANAADVLGGVQALTRQFIAWRLQLRRDAAALELARFERLAAMAHEEKREAVELLRLERSSDPMYWVSRDTPLMSVLDLIGRQIGVTFSDDPAAHARSNRADQIEAIVRVSGTRSRRVRLLGEWWTDDVGPLLAFKKDTGAPMALICTSAWLGMKRTYEIVDGETGERQILTQELSDTLDEIAFSFLRPLPATEALSSIALAKSVMLPFLPDFRLMFLLSLLTGVLGAAMPVANFMMTDRVIPDANRSLMWDLAIGLSCMSVGMFLFGLSTGLLSIRVKTALTAQLQSAIIDRLLRLPARFFRQFPSGDILNRAMMISEISAGFSMTVINSVFSLLSTAMMLAVCFYYSAKLAILALIAALLSSLFSLSFSFMIRQKALGIEIKSGELFGFVVQMVTGVTKLQIAGADQRALNQWARRYGEQLRENYAIAQLQQMSGMINMVIQTGSTVALYYFAGTMVAESAALQAINPLTPPLLTIGTFFAVQGAFGSVVGGIVGFFGSFLTMHQQMAKRDLVRPILEEPVEGGGIKTDPGRLDGHLQMQQITFRYQKDGQKILDNVSLKALPGEFIAIVGPSGSGKSTILKLLLGFDFPESGQILFDKKDINDLDMLAVRRQIGVVLQDGKINAGTIYHAICGANDMSMDEAWEAAAAAGFDEDIKSFPMGMHTLLPEGASTLSGGQRQRLLIARALATRPRIVFFDEATSALDNRTQAVVTESLQQRRVTRVVIAHRLTTIMDADRIYVLEKGVVTQSGNYEQLMAEDGLFQRMARRQLA